MNIQGLQKLTLLDYPGKVACTIFTAGCNFRCPFCHNASLVTKVDVDNYIPMEEVMAFLKKRQGVLDGVCVTGGEPLLQSDLEEFLQEVRALGYQIKLDTNGSFPERLIHLVENNLVDYVAMDIKNSKQSYGKTIGIENYDMENVMRSVEFLKGNAIPFEFRTTVVREFHKKDDFEAIGQWIGGTESYYLQGFKDSGDLIQPGLRGYTKEVMEQAQNIVRQNVPNVQLRGID